MKWLQETAPLKIPYPKQQRLEMGSDAKHISVSSFRKKRHSSINRPFAVVNSLFVCKKTRLENEKIKHGTKGLLSGYCHRNRLYVTGTTWIYIRPRTLTVATFPVHNIYGEYLCCYTIQQQSVGCFLRV